MEDDTVKVDSEMMDSPVEENPGMMDSPVEENPGMTDSPVEENPGMMDSPVEENPGMMDSPVSQAEVTLDFDSMSVAEDSGKKFTYTFTRKSTSETEVDTSNPLTVNFNVSGSATFGEDYKQMGAEEFSANSGIVTIPVGENKVTVTITPITDNKIESDETVKLTLSEGNYIFENSEMSSEVAGTDSSTDEMMVMNVISNDDVNLNLGWAEQLNADVNGYEFLAVDDEGNTYVTGDFENTLTVGTQPALTSQGGSDVFVAKFDKDGTVNWAKGFGDTTNEVVEDIAVDKDGNSYLFMTKGDETTDVTVAKFDTLGELSLEKTFTGTNNNEASGIDVDALGNIFITGELQQQITFGTTTLSSGLSNSVFAAKLNSDGETVWAKGFGETFNHQAEDIVVDKDGNSYLFMTEGSNKAVVAKIDNTDKGEISKKEFSGTNIVSEDIAIDDEGNTYITGEFTGTLQFGNTSLEGGEGGDVFVAKLDSSSNDVLWAKDFDSQNKNDDVEVEGIAVDMMGNTYVTGFYSGDSMSINNFMLYGEGGDGGEGENAFIAKLDSSNGDVKWAQNLGGMNAEEISDIAVKDSKIYIAGTFYKEATFGDKVLTPQNENRDTFLVKLEEGDKPEVTLMVDSNTVTEGDNNKITYTFTRKGEMTAALTVDFTVTGTVTFNEDYTLTGAEEFNGSNGKVNFKAGESTATVTLEVINDSNIEEDETVALSLVEGSGYKLSKTDVAMATVTITSEDKEPIVDENPDNPIDNGDKGDSEDKEPIVDENPDNPIDNGDKGDSEDKEPIVDENPDNPIGNGDDGDNQNQIPIGNGNNDDEDFSLTSENKQTFKFKNKTQGGKSSIKFSFKSKSIEEIKEIGFFTVDDDEGTIDGVSPDNEGYIQAALNRAQSIFSVLGDAPRGFDANIEKILEFSSDKSFRFLSVKNGTLDGVKKGKINRSQVAFSDANFLEASEEKNSFDLDFEGVKIKMQLDGEANKPIGSGLQDEIEVLDLRGLTGKQMATFTVNREAEFDNIVGFYKVTDKEGGIDTDGDGTADILVGDAGYAQAAVQNRIASIDLSVENQSTATFEGEFEAGSIFVPFLMVKGTTDAFDEMFFPYIDANSDGADRVIMLGDNIFGFEDLPGGGDRDFNDIIVKIDFNSMST